MSQTNRRYRIAVIPGDGIGKEVVPEGVRVLEQVAKSSGFALELDWFDFSSYDYYAKHGRMMPEDWKDQVGGHDAIFFGAVGWPAKIPDHISLWGSLIQFRREFVHRTLAVAVGEKMFARLAHDASHGGIRGNHRRSGSRHGNLRKL